MAETAVADATKEIPTRVLVLGMAHDDGTIVGEELYPVAAACGLSAEQVRSCVRRLVHEGLFLRAGSGRTTRLTATEAGMAALGETIERTRLAYGQDAAGRGWDGRWRLVAFAVPENQRSARDALRDRLLDLGGAIIQGGLYVSPHQWHKDVWGEAQRLGIAEAITLATTDELEIGGEREPKRIAARLWALDELAAGYESFASQFSAIPGRLTEMRDHRQRLPDAAFLPAALRMVVAFQEWFARDPLLPPELVPRPWPGRTARELLIRSRRLALAIRQTQGRPALFRWFDDAIESIP